MRKFVYPRFIILRCNHRARQLQVLNLWSRKETVGGRPSQCRCLQTQSLHCGRTSTQWRTLTQSVVCPTGTCRQRGRWSDGPGPGQVADRGGQFKVQSSKFISQSACLSYCSQTRNVKFDIQIGSDWLQMGRIWDFLRSVSEHFGVLKKCTITN